MVQWNFIIGTAFIVVNFTLVKLIARTRVPFLCQFGSGYTALQFRTVHEICLIQRGPKGPRPRKQGLQGFTDKTPKVKLQVKLLSRTSSCPNTNSDREAKQETGLLDQVIVPWSYSPTGFQDGYLKNHKISQTLLSDVLYTLSQHPRVHTPL